MFATTVVFVRNIQVTFVNRVKPDQENNQIHIKTDNN